MTSQRRILDDAADSFAGLRVWTSVYRDREPVGLAELIALALETYDDFDSLAIGASRAPMRVTTGGDELVISVASYRRLLTLPSGLARRRVAGARVHAGELQVRFDDTSSATTKETT